MNNVNIIGRLTKDPELTDVEGKKPVLRFTVAVDRNKHKSDTSDFFRVSIFGEYAKTCNENLKKKSKVGVSGRLQSSKYDDGDGVTHFPIDIIGDYVDFLDQKKD